MKILKNGEVLVGTNMTITKSIWKKVKDETCLNEKDIHQDTDLSIHISKNKGRIIYDWDLVVQTSGRRINKTPFTFFINYPWRLIKTLSLHRF